VDSPLPNREKRPAPPGQVMGASLAGAAIFWRLVAVEDHTTANIPTFAARLAPFDSHRNPVPCLANRISASFSGSSTLCNKPIEESEISRMNAV